MSNEATIVQEKPKPGCGIAAWDLVFIDIRARAESAICCSEAAKRIIRDGLARDAMGKAKYGQRLQAGDGRDHIVDAYQEVLDLAVYLRQEIDECEQRGNSGRLFASRRLYEKAIDIVFEIEAEIRIRKAAARELGDGG